MGNPCKTCLVQPACSRQCYQLKKWYRKKENIKACFQAILLGLFILLSIIFIIIIIDMKI